MSGINVRHSMQQRHEGDSASLDEIQNNFNAFKKWQEVKKQAERAGGNVILFQQNPPVNLSVIVQKFKFWLTQQGGAMGNFITSETAKKARIAQQQIDTLDINNESDLGRQITETRNLVDIACSMVEDAPMNLAS